MWGGSYGFAVALVALQTPQLMVACNFSGAAIPILCGSAALNQIFATLQDLLCETLIGDHHLGQRKNGI